MKSRGLIQAASTALLIIDIQEKLMPVVQDKEQVFLNTNRLLKTAQILNIPTIITEQYPNGLGHTCTDIEIPENTQVIEKICFSCLQSQQVIETLQKHHIKSLIIGGVESHICVLKTALEAMNTGLEVHVVADAVSSRTAENKQIALERMKQSGAFIVSTEMILFQLIDKAGTDAFKFISKLIK